MKSMKHDTTHEIVIIEDTREQKPLDFTPYAQCGISVERRRLRTGDYSVAGYEPFVLIERKSLQDLVGTLTRDRERFMREIYDRAPFYAVRHLVVEAAWQEISAPYSFSMANPRAIVNSLYSLTMPPTSLHVFASQSRALIAWHIVNVAVNFVRRATHGSQGVYRSIWADDSADLAPIPCPYQEVV